MSADELIASESKTKEGIVFDIQRYCLHDGPGVRTVVFLKGCSLRCRWCANPESQCTDSELLYDRHRCIGCGICVNSCPESAIRLQNDRIVINRHLCTVCEICSEMCPSQALRISGTRMNVLQVIDAVELDRLFFEESGGGVTLSGGEPLVQHEFSLALLRSMKSRGVHTAIETAGNISFKTIESVLDSTDLFLFDLKHADSCKAFYGTGSDNALALDNLSFIAQSGKRLIVRYTLIPDFNTDKASVEKFAACVHSMNISEVELLPFHRLGEGKYRQLARKYPYYGYNPLEQNEVDMVRSLLLKNTEAKIVLVK